MTECVVYLLQARLQPRGKRTTRDGWETLGAYLDRAEAEAAKRAGAHRHPRGQRVYGVPAHGALAALLAGPPAGLRVAA